MGLYTTVTNKFDARTYHVSTIENPALRFWETAVFKDPGPALGGEVLRGDFILPLTLASAAPPMDLREQELTDLSRLGSKGTHAYLIRRVRDTPPSDWVMTAEQLESHKQFVLDFIDARGLLVVAAQTRHRNPLRVLFRVLYYVLKVAKYIFGGSLILLLISLPFSFSFDKLMAIVSGAVFLVGVIFLEGLALSQTVEPDELGALARKHGI